MTAHRAPGPTQYPRVRKGRVAVLAAAVLTTAVAFLGGIGVLPSSASGNADAASLSRVAGQDGSADTASLDAGTSARTMTTPTTPTTPTTTTPPTPTPTTTPTTPTPDPSAVLPADSGSGRRVVFSQSAQRVWIVDASDDHVERSYLVSGSLTDNLDPGTYSVYSRSLHAVGVDDSGTMTHFVRFARGPSGAAIGFHDIPSLGGHKVQTRAQLGTPQSHGCIRQAEGDAIAMWDFAALGTQVVVVA